MEWTKEQREAIYEDYWNHRPSHCPNDKAVLDVRLDYEVLFARCPRCRENFQMNRMEDPQKGSFRDWTPKEIGTFVDEHFQKQDSKCPVCQKEVVNVVSTPFSGMTVLYFTCARCGNRHEEKVK